MLPKIYSLLESNASLLDNIVACLYVVLKFLKKRQLSSVRLRRPLRSTSGGRRRSSSAHLSLVTVCRWRPPTLLTGDWQVRVAVVVGGWTGWWRSSCQTRQRSTWCLRLWHCYDQTPTILWTWRRWISSVLVFRPPWPSALCLTTPVSTILYSVYTRPCSFVVNPLKGSGIR